MNSKVTASLFVLSFITPLLLAYVILKTGYFQTGVNNHGVFLSEEIRIKDWQLNDHKPWNISYLPENPCLEQCQSTIESLIKSHLVLGKKNKNVDLLLINSEIHHDAFRNISQSNKILSSEYIYLIDFNGLVLMQYDLKKQPINKLLKGLVLDIKKLLKYARSENTLLSNK